MQMNPRRLTIVVRASQKAGLYRVAVNGLLTAPRAAAPLLSELERAQVLPDDEVADQVAGLESVVEFSQDDGERRTVQLTAPASADARRGRISVLEPVGAALFGRSPGQSVVWCDRIGPARRVVVLSVRPGPCGPSSQQP